MTTETHEYLGTLEDLAELERRATPAPWIVEEPWGGMSEIRTEAGDAVMGLSAINCLGNLDGQPKDEGLIEANALLLVHARNALPGLLARVQQHPEALTPLEAVRQYREWHAIATTTDEVYDPETDAIRAGVEEAQAAALAYRQAHPALDAILRELEESNG